MENHPGITEQLGPRARLQEELTKLESQRQDLWILIAFVVGVLVLGALSFLAPESIWRHNELELKFPPQFLFFIMMLVVVLTLYLVRRESEMRRLRLVNLQQMLAAQTEQTTGMIDSLTNVFSRSFLRELVEGEIARAERNKRPLSVIMCDLDHFKQVNDRYGHLMGDYVLAQMAGILKSCVRGSDFVIRYGGDEFLLLLSDTDEGGAQIVKGRIEQKIGEWDQTNRVGDTPVSASLGLVLHSPGQSPEQLVAAADARMYMAKHGGRRQSEVGATGA